MLLQSELHLIRADEEVTKAVTKVPRISSLSINCKKLQFPLSYFENGITLGGFQFHNRSRASDESIECFLVAHAFKYCQFRLIKRISDILKVLFIPLLKRNEAKQALELNHSSVIQRWKIPVNSKFRN